MLSTRSDCFLSFSTKAAHSPVGSFSKNVLLSESWCWCCCRWCLCACFEARRRFGETTNGGDCEGGDSVNDDEEEAVETDGDGASSLEATAGCCCLLGCGDVG